MKVIGSEVKVTEDISKKTFFNWIGCVTGGSVICGKMGSKGQIVTRWKMVERGRHTHWRLLVEFCLVSCVPRTRDWKWDGIPHWHFLGRLETTPLLFFSVSQGQHGSQRTADYLITSTISLLWAAWFSTQNAPPETVFRRGSVQTCWGDHSAPHTQ